MGLIGVMNLLMRLLSMVETQFTRCLHSDHVSVRVFQQACECKAELSLPSLLQRQCTPGSSERVLAETAIQVPHSTMLAPTCRDPRAADCGLLGAVQSESSPTQSCRRGRSLPGSQHGNRQRTGPQQGP